MLWLSFPLDVNGPRPPAIPAPTLKLFNTIETDGAAVQILTVANHTGTHVDAPRHVIKDGLCLTDFSPREFIFTHPVVIELSLEQSEVVTPDDLKPLERQFHGADLVLFRFGYGRLRREKPKQFNDRCPGFGVEAARWLRECFPEMRAVGMDVPSVACIAHLEETMGCHNELFGGKGRRFLIIEDMNLEYDLHGLHEVRLGPWLVTGMDSGPCSVLGIIR